MKIINFSPKYLNDIIAIENASFPKPWTREMFLDSLDNETVRFNLALENDHVAGYCLFSIVCETAEILSIAVAPEFRRRSFAKQMIMQSFDLARLSGAREMFLEVRAGNTAAQKLYLSLGFEQTAVRKKYYIDEDGIILRKGLQ